MSNCLWGAGSLPKPDDNDLVSSSSFPLAPPTWLAHNNPPLAPVLEGARHSPPSNDTHPQHYEQLLVVWIMGTSSIGQ
jgi:hypothetical protein